MSLQLTEQGGGVQFAVKVVPGAARDRIAGLYGGALKVQVAAPPGQGRANARLCEVLAAALAVPERSVRVLTGSHGPRKTVHVAGLGAADVRSRLRLP